MSVLEASNDVRVWDNAAFDSGGGMERSVEMKTSWMDLDKGCLSESAEYDSSKENQNPLICNSPALFKTPGTGEIESKKSGPMLMEKKDSCLRDDAIIDLEIAQIEMELNRLGLKLEALRLEKDQRKVKIRERRVSIVPAKYMEPKQSTIPKLGSHHKVQSPTPQRRGVSLCPAEIYSATKSRQLATNSNSGVKQNRRQSCFWKLGEIDELKVTKERGGGKSASVSPKSRKPVPKFDSSKKAVTSIGSRKLVTKDVAVLSSVQPKKLFKESERSVTSKKPIKSGRVIASRYNQNITQNSLNDGVSKLRSSSETEQQETKRRESVAGSGSRVKKRWEIPAKGEVVVYMSDAESTPAVDEISDVVVPKIRTVRCVNETPRDSGAVKRVADLVGKKSFFGGGGGGVVDVDVRQALSFADEEVDGAQI
ncbi:hypothetical protein QQ045_017120 [Rhodiola kirilowii]